MTEITCAHCGEEFIGDRPEDEVNAEREELFPGQECELVCEDCFKKIMGVMEPETDISKWTDQ